MEHSTERNRTDDLLEIVSAAETPTPRGFLEDCARQPDSLGFGVRALYESLAYLETNRLVSRQPDGFTVTNAGFERLRSLEDASV